LHTLWQLPKDDHEYSKRWSNIKKYFSTGCQGVDKTISKSRRSKRERNVWQRRFWEHTVRGQNDWNRHLDYIHYNPVKHGVSLMPEEWPYSSFGKWMNKGVYGKGWGQVEPDCVRNCDWE